MPGKDLDKNDVLKYEPTKIDTTSIPPKKSSALTVLIIILLVVIVGAGAYWYFVLRPVNNTTTSITPSATLSTSISPTATSTSSTSVSPSPSVSAANESWKNDVNSKIATFYTDMQALDAISTMSLFSAPQNSEETGAYDGIMDTDLPNPAPRLFATATLGNYKILSYNIVSYDKISDSEAVIKVTESRDTYDNTKLQWIGASDFTRYFDLVKQNGNWAINKYYTTSHTNKYDGLYNMQ